MNLTILKEEGEIKAKHCLCYLSEFKQSHSFTKTSLKMSHWQWITLQSAAYKAKSLKIHCTCQGPSRNGWCTLLPRSNWGEFNERIISQRWARVMGTDKKWQSTQGWATLRSCYYPQSLKDKVTDLVRAELWKRGSLEGAMVLNRGIQLPNQSLAANKLLTLSPPALSSPEGGSHGQIQPEDSRELPMRIQNVCWG